MNKALAVEGLREERPGLFKLESALTYTPHIFTGHRAVAGRYPNSPRTYNKTGVSFSVIYDRLPPVYQESMKDLRENHNYPIMIR
jgi:hypothetical protein